MEDGAWLLTGEITGVSEGRAGARPDSLFNDLLRRGSEAHLKMVVERMADVGDVYHVSGDVPWGLYEVWIDPTRGYNIVKLIADVTPASIPGRVRYETQSVRVAQIHGKWIPDQATLLTTSIQDSGASVFETETRISLSEITFLTGDEPGSMFNIEFPSGLKIHDRVLDIKYGGEFEHPLDSLVADVMKDKSWTDEHRADRVDEASRSLPTSTRDRYRSRYLLPHRATSMVVINM